MSKGILAILLCLMSVPDLIHSQPATKGGRSQKAITGNYRLGPGDLLSVKVLGLEEFNQVVRVSNSGKINLKFLGVLRAAGMAVLELENHVARQLQEQKLVKDPYVQILVTEYRAQPVYILGEVGRPGQYVMYHTMELVELIAMSGGTMGGAREYAYLYRRATPTDHNFLEKTKADNPGSEATTQSQDPPAPHYDVIKIDLSKLQDGDGTVEPNLVLQGGDILHVLKFETDYFYVVGDVLSPGGYELPRFKAAPYLVSRALSMAGGPTKTAKMSDGVLVRYDDKGGREELPLDFAAIFKGKRPDFPVRANDIIFIPGSNFKTIGYGLLGTLPNIAEKASYSGVGLKGK